MVHQYIIDDIDASWYAATRIYGGIHSPFPCVFLA